MIALRMHHQVAQLNEVDLNQSDAERCFLSHAGKIALSRRGGVNSYSFPNAI